MDYLGYWHFLRSLHDITNFTFSKYFPKSEFYWFDIFFYLIFYMMWIWYNWKCNHKFGTSDFDLSIIFFLIRLQIVSHDFNQAIVSLSKNSIEHQCFNYANHDSHGSTITVGIAVHKNESQYFLNIATIGYLFCLWNAYFVVNNNDWTINVNHNKSIQF